MLDPAFSRGLPSLLAPAAGINSGYMLAHYTASSLGSENKVLAQAPKSWQRGLGRALRRVATPLPTARYVATERCRHPAIQDRYSIVGVPLSL
jgi:hypothetical protein